MRARRRRSTTPTWPPSIRRHHDVDARADADEDADADRRPTSAHDRRRGRGRRSTTRTPAHIVDEISELAAERDQFRDIAQRLQADFENYRKRVHAAERGRGRAGRRQARRGAAAGARRDRGRVRAPPRRGRAAAQPDAGRAAQARARGRSTCTSSRSTRTSPRPSPTSPATAATWSSPRCSRSGYRWKGRTLRPAMVRTRD